VNNRPPLELDGRGLTIELLRQVAVERRSVKVTNTAIARLEAGRELVYRLAETDVPVYGFNRGVGWNKDKPIPQTFFESYNHQLILSHCAGAGPEASIPEVRAAMLARLNGLLQGCTGINPRIALLYAEFLNKGIHPIMPQQGSVGAGDITTISHIGLAFIGEGEVEYRGQRLSAREALHRSGLELERFGPKDGLAVVSSNAQSAGNGALVLSDIAMLLDTADIIYALSLEGLQGNISPLEESVYKKRPYAGHGESLRKINALLKGSGLQNPARARALQDPLSFRAAAQIHGAAREAWQFTAAQLELHLNSSDDNPCLLLEEERIESCANFEALSWSLGFEMLGSGLHHVAKTSVMRILKLGNPAFSGLERFLAPDAYSNGFATLQKTVAALEAEIRHLSNPISADFIALAGDIEDHSTNAPYLVKKTRSIVERSLSILGIEALHAAQAIDLRQQLQIGEGSRIAYEIIRENISFYRGARPLTGDLQSAAALLQSGQLIEAVRPIWEREQ
jgi:histidine ammonia-lyase